MIPNNEVFLKIMEILGQKWVIPLIALLLPYEERNFTYLKKSLKVTSRTLSKKLKELENLGLVEKIVKGPKKISYILSESGKELASGMINFAGSLNSK